MLPLPLFTHCNLMNCEEGVQLRAAKPFGLGKDRFIRKEITLQMASHKILNFSTEGEFGGTAHLFSRPALLCRPCIFGLGSSLVISHHYSSLNLA